jgi:diadenylate cyclase
MASLQLLNINSPLVHTLDILLVAIIIYFILIFIKQTRSYSVFYALIILFVLNFLTTTLQLSLSRKILNQLVTFIAVIFVIVFQREIRRFFRWLINSFGKSEKHAARLTSDAVSELSNAILAMAKRRMGAIVVLCGEYPLDDIVEGGFELEGKISAPLLLSIFDHASPGHDGAMIIEDKVIKRFGVHLPLAEHFKGFAKMGTRHRAAIGITERTDALAIIVSEERGTVSIAEKGALRSLPTPEDLDFIIRRFMSDSEREKGWSLGLLFESDLILRIVSLIASGILWFVFIY